MEQGGGRFLLWRTVEILSLDFLESGIAFGPWHMRQIPIGQRW